MLRTIGIIAALWLVVSVPASLAMAAIRIADDRRRPRTESPRQPADDDPGDSSPGSAAAVLARLVANGTLVEEDQ